jgi:hypothetical protein
MARPLLVGLVLASFLLAASAHGGEELAYDEAYDAPSRDRQMLDTTKESRPADSITVEGARPSSQRRHHARRTSSAISMQPHAGCTSIACSAVTEQLQGSSKL